MVKCFKYIQYKYDSNEKTSNSIARSFRSKPSLVFFFFLRMGGKLKNWNNGSNDNMLSIRDGKSRVEWMVCRSYRQYLHHSLLPPAIIEFLSQNDENFHHHLQQKNLDVPFWEICQYLKLCSLPALYCTTTVVLHYLAPQCQCCNLYCIDEILS